ncbi:MAG: hypothetical protein ACRDBG_14350 [Waterburya sp.]
MQIIKEDFVEILTEIAKQRRLDHKNEEVLTTALKSVFSDGDALIIFRNPLIDSLVKKLDSVFCPESKMVDWWVWETSCGRKDLSCFSEDGKEWSLLTPEKLYEFVTFKSENGL